MDGESVVTPPLTDYQADQLRRLTDTLERYPGMDGAYAVCYCQGVRETDVPEVYRELRDLGVVTISFSDSIARVRPVVE
jgi:hypothetical protein